MSITDSEDPSSNVVGGNSGPISIDGNVVTDGTSGALIVSGYVQGSGSNDNPVI